GLGGAGARNRSVRPAQYSTGGLAFAAAWPGTFSYWTWTAEGGVAGGAAGGGEDAQAVRSNAVNVNVHVNEHVHEHVNVHVLERRLISFPPAGWAARALCGSGWCRPGTSWRRAGRRRRSRPGSGSRPRRSASSRPRRTARVPAPAPRRRRSAARTRT